MKYRKKPIEIEAEQYVPENKLNVQELLSDVEHAFTDEGLLIRTLEGVMKADEGDFVTKELATGRFCVCDVETFEKNHVEVREEEHLTDERCAQYKRTEEGVI